MILLLGKNEIVEVYAKKLLKINKYENIAHYPDATTHYTELDKYIEIARKEQPSVITTQNLEMIDVFLTSDLEFDVITVGENEKGIWERRVSKEKAWQLRHEYGLELR